MAKKGTTRYYSSKQEEYIAKLLGGRTTPNSGAAHHVGGDVLAGDWLIECKTTTRPKESFSIKKDWITKNERERRDLQKPYSAICFQFEEDGENYFIVNEKIFKELLNSL